MKKNGHRAHLATNTKNLGARLVGPENTMAIQPPFTSPRDGAISFTYLWNALHLQADKQQFNEMMELSPQLLPSQSQRLMKNMTHAIPVSRENSK